MRRYALVASDVDGTFTDSADELRPAVREAVAEARAAGVRVVLATGRGPRAVARTIGQLGYDLPLILTNGAIITEGLHQPPLLHNLLPAELAADLIPWFREAGLEPLVFDDPNLTSQTFYERRHPANEAFLTGRADHLIHVPDLVAACDHPLMAVIAFGAEAVIRGFAAELAERLGSRGVVQPYWHPKYDSWAMDVAAAGSTKANGLRQYGARHGIALSEMIAIGDSLNDLPMLQAAGWGVAMGNATDEVKAAADAVVADNDHDGVAEAIWRFALGRDWP